MGVRGERERERERVGVRFSPLGREEKFIYSIILVVRVGFEVVIVE